MPDTPAELPLTPSTRVSGYFTGMTSVSSKVIMLPFLPAVKNRVGATQLRGKVTAEGNENIKMDKYRFSVCASFQLCRHLTVFGGRDVNEGSIHTGRTFK